MSRLQWRIFCVAYWAYALLWLLVGLAVNFSGARWVVKLVVSLGLVIVTPTLEGPWRYGKYVTTWNAERTVPPPE